MRTWAIPDTLQKINQAAALCLSLECFKVMIQPIIGDDKLFDHIDNAISRINELTYSASSHAEYERYPKQGDRRIEAELEKIKKLKDSSA